MFLWGLGHDAGLYKAIITLTVPVTVVCFINLGFHFMFKTGRQGEKGNTSYRQVASNIFIWKNCMDSGVYGSGDSSSVTRTQYTYFPD